MICAVGVAAGWFWLGSSGAGLITLWCSVLHPWRQAPFELAVPVADLTGCIITPWHVVVKIPGATIEVFRDELSRRDWTLLRATLRLAADTA